MLKVKEKRTVAKPLSLYSLKIIEKKKLDSAISNPIQKRMREMVERNKFSFIFSIASFYLNKIGNKRKKHNGF